MPSHRKVLDVTAPLAVALLTAALTTSPAPAAGVDPATAGEQPIRVIRDSAGLPQNTVHAIIVDRKGFLWAGTQDGAAFYDGRAWTTVDLPDRMRSSFVRAILSAADGSLWFGTQAGGLHRLLDGAWITVALPVEDGDRCRINALLETTGLDGEGVVWVGTHDDGVIRLHGDRATRFTEAQGLPSSRIWALTATAEEGSTAVWAGTEGGLARLTPDGKRFERVPGAPEASVNSFAEVIDPGGRHALWVGTYGKGVVRLGGDGPRHITAAEGLPDDHVTSLAVDRSQRGDAALWVGTDGGGLAHIAPDGVHVLDVRSGLPSDAVYSLLSTLPDNGGQALWVGTRNGGLARIRAGQWLSFHPIAATPAVAINAVLESRDAEGGQEMWLGTDGGGLARLRDGAWTVFDERSGSLPSDIVQCLLQTIGPGGRRVLWVGTRNGGLARLEGGRWEHIRSGPGALPNDMIQALLATRDVDGSDVLWVGTRGGLARRKHGRWEEYGTGEGLPHPSVQVLLETTDDQGQRHVFAGTAAGLARWDGGRFVPQPMALLNHSVQSLKRVVEADGRPVLWIGTDGGGVARLALTSPPRELSPLTDRGTPRLPNNVIYQILQTPDGRIHLLTNRGVARLTPASGGGWEVHTFSVEDGLPLNQCVRGAGIVDHLGRIWVGTVGGAAMLDPTRETVDRVPKPLVLDGFIAANGRRPLRNGDVLRRDQGHLVFQYSLLSFFREGDTRYRAQVVGLDAEPSDWTADFRKELRTVPSGRFAFRVWGRDFAGNVSGPVEIAFVVKPSPWGSAWAVAAYLALAVLLVGGVLQVRLHVHRRRERDLQGLVDARTRELKEANELLSDLSYHDPLTGIANRRRFGERLDAEWRRAVRGRTALSLVMVDIDYFKAYNDTYGHQRGDECLEAIARALADGLPRAGDSVARYGGEEFAIILPLTERRGAVTLAESLRNRVASLGIPHGSSNVARVVTISCGVATVYPSSDVAAAELVRLADESLYGAKQSGRNRTVAQHGEPRSGVVRPAARDADLDAPPVPPATAPEEE